VKEHRMKRGMRVRKQEKGMCSIFIGYFYRKGVLNRSKVAWQMLQKIYISIKCFSSN